MIMYFVETVTRDMGESAGGSVFYIRNRIKEALVTPTEAVAGEAEAGETAVQDAVGVVDLSVAHHVDDRVHQALSPGVAAVAAACAAAGSASAICEKASSSSAADTNQAS